MANNHQNSTTDRMTRKVRPYATTGDRIQQLLLEEAFSPYWYTSGEIADALQLDPAVCSEALRYLRENGLVSYQQQSGRGKPFIYRAVIPVVKATWIERLERFQSDDGAVAA